MITCQSYQLWRRCRSLKIEICKCKKTRGNEDSEEARSGDCMAYFAFRTNPYPTLLERISCCWNSINRSLALFSPHLLKPLEHLITLLFLPFTFTFTHICDSLTYPTMVEAHAAKANGHSKIPASSLPDLSHHINASTAERAPNMLKVSFDPERDITHVSPATEE